MLLHLMYVAYTGLHVVQGQCTMLLMPLLQILTQSVLVLLQCIACMRCPCLDWLHADTHTGHLRSIDGSDGAVVITYRAQLPTTYMASKNALQA